MMAQIESYKLGDTQQHAVATTMYSFDNVMLYWHDIIIGSYLASVLQ